MYFHFLQLSKMHRTLTPREDIVAFIHYMALRRTHMRRKNWQVGQRLQRRPFPTHEMPHSCPPFQSERGNRGWARPALPISRLESGQEHPGGLPGTSRRSCGGGCWRGGALRAFTDLPFSPAYSGVSPWELGKRGGGGQGEEAGKGAPPVCPCAASRPGPATCAAPTPRPSWDPSLASSPGL